jgi:hypothetical protein
MGLAERKLVQAAKETDYKDFETKMKGIVGFDVKLDFDWATLEACNDFADAMRLKRYNERIFDRIAEAFTEICADDMGKTAVKEGLKEIKMFAKEGPVEFAAGVLTVNSDLGSGGSWPASRIKSEVEKGL